MNLRNRLSRLEAITKAALDAPRVMIFHACWRDDAGNLQSIAQFAKVLTANGWEVVRPEGDETDDNFALRAEGMAKEAKINLRQSLA